jgi:hypothetical protein
LYRVPLRVSCNDYPKVMIGLVVMPMVCTLSTGAQEYIC